MNVIDTVRAVCADYPGKAEAVAARIGKSVHTLRHELGEYEGYKLGIQTVLDIMAVTKDPRIPTAIAAELGFTIIQCPHVEDVGAEFMPYADKTLSEFSGMLSASITSWADRHITPEENRSVQARGAAAIGAIQAVMRVTNARCIEETNVAPQLREVA